MLLFAVLWLVVEVVSVVLAAATFGVAATVIALLAMSVCGTWVVRREGLSLARRARADLAAGRSPSGAMLDGLLLVVAGLLLAPPGFVSGALGLVLLIGPVRRLVSGWLSRSAERNLQRRLAWVQRFGAGPAGGFGGFWSAGGPGAVRVDADVIDLDGEEVVTPTGRPELRPR